MSWKSTLSKPYAKLAAKKIKRWGQNGIEEQEKVFQRLVSEARQTRFGKDHRFSEVSTPKDFQQAVPMRDYEAHKPYIERMLTGESDVLWKGKPIYFCKTSGTTSGTKFIPISKESISNHIDSARNALLSYIAQTGNARFVDGKMIFLQGSPKLNYKTGIPVGRLSGIVAHHVPSYLQKNRLPTMEINSIEDWETKLNSIVDTTINQDMRLISGIPSWVQMYFESLLEKSGKSSISNLFPNFSLFVYGGVNFKPYEAIFSRLIGKSVDTVETYPASEGFIAFQDSQTDEGLLLVTNHGIFYEFIPLDEYHSENPRRLTLEQVEIGINYAIILSTNAGLWAYSIGDTVKFVSLNPFRIVVTGRIKHFTSAFGEHVIAEEVEKSMSLALEKFGGSVAEFHVAPQVEPSEGLPYHEWFVEFKEKPQQLTKFAAFIDEEMQHQNIYYKDLITGSILKPLVLNEVQGGGFQEMMKKRGKLGGQNKVPRLANDRSIADLLAL